MEDHSVRQAAKEVDRLAPAHRPPGRRAMVQRWHDLLFLHWAVEPKLLERYLPEELTLDTFDGLAYVGLIPFTMTDIRPLWSPRVAGLSNFHEVNLRTYVHREGRDPGVWFLSLDAGNRLAVRIAQTLWRLPYHFAHLELSKGSGEDPRITYEAERVWPGPLPAACRMTYQPVGEARLAEPGALDHFLVERYLLYAKAGNRLYRGQVHHSPYHLRSVRLDEMQEDMLDAAGLVRPPGDPIVHYSLGVNVDVYPLRRQP
jgi:uncharacterized protein